MGHFSSFSSNNRTRCRESFARPPTPVSSWAAAPAAACWTRLGARGRPRWRQSAHQPVLCAPLHHCARHRSSCSARSRTQLICLAGVLPHLSSVPPRPPSRHETHLTLRPRWRSLTVLAGGGRGLWLLFEEGQTGGADSGFIAALKSKDGGLTFHGTPELVLPKTTDWHYRGGACGPMTYNAAFVPVRAGFMLAGGSPKLMTESVTGLATTARRAFLGIALLTIAALCVQARRHRCASPIQPACCTPLLGEWHCAMAELRGRFAT